jgi:hypothetical protein
MKEGTILDSADDSIPHPHILTDKHLYIYTYTYSSTNLGLGSLGGTGEADQLRRYVLPFREICPSLFAVLSGAAAFNLAGPPFGFKEDNEVRT